MLAYAFGQMQSERIGGVIQAAHSADMVDQQRAQRDRDTGLGQRSHEGAHGGVGRALGLPGGDALEIGRAHV